MCNMTHSYVCHDSFICVTKFLVPNILADGSENDCEVISLNRKMGHKALSNCAWYVVVCCSVLQCVAVCCSDNDCEVVRLNCKMGHKALSNCAWYVAVCCSVLQRVAVCCSVLQCVAAITIVKWFVLIARWAIKPFRIAPGML